MEFAKQKLKKSIKDSKNLCYDENENATKKAIL